MEDKDRMKKTKQEVEKETVWLKLPDATFSRGGILGILRLALSPPSRSSGSRGRRSGRQGGGSFRQKRGESRCNETNETER